MNRLSTAEHPLWITSSYSDNGGQCVEVALNLAPMCGAVPVRDSKNVGSGLELSLSTTAFAAFVEHAKTCAL